MKFLSLFSGVGGFDLAMERAGMQCVGQAERDKHCLKVLNHHWPDVPKYEDVRNVTTDNTPAVDVIVGGFPCQDVSVAGRRAGLAGERSGLWFEFLRILRDLTPKWVIVENVPGLLSSNQGRDFATILYGLGECGYRTSWRVLDAQYFGVPQRRRRVFLVASLRSGRSAQVLFERESGGWNSEPRKTERQGIASVTGTLSASGSGTARTGNGNETDLIVPITRVYGSAENSTPVNSDQSPTVFHERGFERWIADDRTPTINAHEAKEAHSLVLAYRNQGFGAYSRDDMAKTLEANSGGMKQDFIAINLNASSTTDQPVRQSGLAGTLATSRVEGVFNQSGVRRLTPRECERLQGFPDDWTAVDNMPDSQRYKQMGNAIAVPVVEWIARRIMQHA
jgi:DNA (cytosine-5)-methyltransferase 1